MSKLSIDGDLSYTRSIAGKLFHTRGPGSMNRLNPRFLRHWSKSDLNCCSYFCSTKASRSASRFSLSCLARSLSRDCRSSAVSWPPVIAAAATQYSALSPSNNSRNLRHTHTHASTQAKQSIASGTARRYAPRRRWQKSRRIYRRLRTGPQSAHLWWPRLAELQAASVPRQLLQGTDRRTDGRTDGAIPKCPLRRGT